MGYSLPNLDTLEAEGVHTIREVAAAFENPVDDDRFRLHPGDVPQMIRGCGFARWATTR